jgi:hypothetical protein
MVSERPVDLYRVEGIITHKESARRRVLLNGCLSLWFRLVFGCILKIYLI